MDERRVNWYSIVLHLFLVALAVQVVYLTIQNRQLRQGGGASTLPRLAKGDAVPPLEFVGLDGAAGALDYGKEDRDVLLFVFNTRCAYCKANQVNWKALYQRVRDDVEVVGVCVDEDEATKEYVREYSLPFRVVRPAQLQQFTVDYKLPGVPATVHIGRDGKVIQTWSGPLAPDHELGG